MSKRNLLLCFDAFGTLFKPKQPIAQQYGEVARSLGMTGFTDEALEKEFRKVFKRKTKEYPNYGKKTNTGSAQWWTMVIHHTFQPLIGSNRKIDPKLAPRLIERFASAEGYDLFPDVLPLLRQLPRKPNEDEGRVVVGVVTNSDDRVPDTLMSLGLRVGPNHYGGPHTISEERYDVDFSVMSYDVGHQKPDQRMFGAAEDMLRVSSLAASDGTDPSTWDKIYVGDEYVNDVQGAVDAGWKAVLIDRKTAGQSRVVSWMDGQAPGSLSDLFQKSNAVGFSSLAKLAEWLPKSTQAHG